MVDFVALLESAQNPDRVLHVWLTHEHGLEAAGQGSIFFDVLAVLVDRRGTDCAQFAARQHRLQQVGRIDGTLGRACAHDRVEFVDKQHDLTLSRCHLTEYGFESLLELATKLGSCQERAHVERPDLATAQTLRHVAGNDAHGEALGNGGFANAWLADQYRIVFRAS